MSLCGCNCRCNCVCASLIGAGIVGVVTAFLQITGVITLTPVFLLAAAGAAVVYLALLAVATVRAGCSGQCACLRNPLQVLLIGILGTVLLAGLLLAVGIVATSVISAILVGLLLFFVALSIFATACLVRCLAENGL